jgi:hypothetical protein
MNNKIIKIDYKKIDDKLNRKNRKKVSKINNQVQ